MEFNLRILFKKSSYFGEFRLVVSSFDNIISRNRNIVNCAFLIFHNFNLCIKGPIPLLSGWGFSVLYSCIEEKMYHHLDLEEHWSKIFQTSLDNMLVG